MPTRIEWCDETFNPWWGCAEVSPGCAHCYARIWATWTRGKDLWPAKGQPSTDHAVSVTAEGNWRKPLKWARTLPGQIGRRPRIFTASMADVFEDLPALEDPRVRLMMLIERTPELDWLVLTKRPDFARDWLTQWYGAVAKRGTPDMPTLPYPNVWVGTSIENARYTWRADVLREIPAAVRFISAEPLLGSLFKSAAPGGPRALEPAPPGEASGVGNEPGTGAAVRKPLDLSGIDWVIAGGESGPRARPSHPDWFRELRDACQSTCGLGLEFDHECNTHPAFFFKQWGEWAPGALPLSLNGRPIGPQVTHVAVKSGQGYSSVMARLGKKRAGRLLDGRVWDEFPQSAVVAAC
jgi:protein gp37